MDGWLVEMKNRYYIVSNKHADRNDRHWTFWKPKGIGYTYDLNEAGLFSKDYSKEYRIVHRRNNRFKYETFYVREDRVEEILGKLQTCVYK